MRSTNVVSDFTRRNLPRSPATLALLAAVLLASPSGAGAQVEGFPGAGPGSDGEVVDRIVAVVGDSIILQSQVNEELLRLEMAGQQVPTDPEGLQALQDQIAQAYVRDLLLVQAAERDTLVDVSDARVDEIFREAWEDQVRNFGGEANLRELLEQEGRSVERYREESRAMIRRSLLIQSYLQMQRANIQGIAVDESEVREFFERERQRIGQRPSTLTVHHLFFRPSASPEAREEARERAEEILEMLRQGESFADLARRFSDDEGSRQQGGDLGWYRRGDNLVEEFEDAAFRLRERQVSGVVETDYGAHIIQIERVRGAERKIHHILVAAEPTAADEERLRARMGEIVEEVRGGRELLEFSDEATRFPADDSITVPRDQLEQLNLPEPYVRAVGGAAEGEVVGPVELPLPQGTIYAVAHVKEVREAGEFTFEDVRDQIRNFLREEKFEERVLSDLRARMHVDIRL